MKEVWKDIPLFKGYYKISNLGRIKSLNRTIKTINGQYRIYKSKIIKGYPHKKTGHLHIKICKNNKNFHINVARLVLTLFKRPAKNNEFACHYPDKNPCNNKIDNLMWGTVITNNNHKYFHGTVVRGIKHHKTKFSENDIKNIFKLFKNKSSREIAKIYNVNKSTILRIVNEDTWHHLNIEV